MNNFFKKKFLRVPNLHIGGALKEIGRNAFVDWLLVMVISLTTALGLVFGGLYLYWSISSGNFKGNQVVGQSNKKVFDENQLKLIINKYQSKEDTSVQIKRGYRGPADPSI